jgi:hypothetical protein
MKTMENDTPIIKASKKSKFAVICAVIFILLGVLLVYMEVRGDQNPLRIGAYIFLILGACYWIFPIKTSSQVIIRQLVSLFLLGALFASCLFALFVIIGRGHESGAPQEFLLIVTILTIAFTVLTLIGSIIVGVRIYKKVLG